MNMHRIPFFMVEPMDNFFPEERPGWLKMDNIDGEP